MHSRAKMMRGRLLSCILAFLVVSCSTAPPVQEGPPVAGNDRQLQQAEKLARDGNHAAAAQAYEGLSGQYPQELRDRLLLRAAREYVRAGNVDKANTLLTRVAGTLPTQDFVLRAETAAEIALRTQRPDRTLIELDRIPQPLPRDAVADILGLRARAQFALKRPAQAVATALEREKALTSEQDLRANQRLIWEGLQQSASGNADFSVQPGASRAVTGWLDLGRAALASARNPFTAKEDLNDWRSRYPNHPANEFLTEEVLPDLGVGLEYPRQIALILPLSGRTQAAGVAVRDGFMAALLQQDPTKRPLVNVYDSVAMGAATAYQRAIAEGAEFVVGPLVKEDVAALAVSNTTSVLTLALNLAPDNAVPPPLMFQFALDPEEEARQVAQRVAADTKMRGLVLLPNNDWGTRVHRAFLNELTTLGGTIAGVHYYDPSARDYSGPIRDLLLINESLSRSNALNSLLGQRLEFEPRRRGDVQFVFIGAQPAQGRTLRPALRFYLADDLPVYSTSDIFEPDTQANNDIDGVIFPDMPWVISPDAVSTELRTALSKHWPVRARGRGRLYAFGFDAYRLVPMLKAGKVGNAHAIPGMTGLLSVDDKGRVRRELDWARVSDGKPLPVGTAATAATR
jgi:outer membrane PBP1 activator LpoA protein